MSALAIRCLLVAALTAPSAAAFAATATYQIRFEADWSTLTHPSAYPPNAHFSSLIGASHKYGVRLWHRGELASLGIERMAETGGTFMLNSEVQTLINAGLAGSAIFGGGAGSPGGTTINEVTVRDEFPYISLVTMIAPSPDWFVGADAVSLVARGAWLPSVTVPLYPYDAGTDHAANFTAPDIEAVPHVPIARVTDVPLDNGTPLGRFVFTLVSASAPPDGLMLDSFEAPTN